MHKKRPLPSGSSDPSGKTGHLSPKVKPPLAHQTLSAASRLSRGFFRCWKTHSPDREQEQMPLINMEIKRSNGGSTLFHCSYLEIY